MSLKSYIKEFLLIESKYPNFYLHFNNETKTFTNFNDLINFVYSNQKDLDKIKFYINHSEKWEKVINSPIYVPLQILIKFKESKSEYVYLHFNSETKTFTNFNDLAFFVYSNIKDLDKIKFYNNHSKKWEKAKDLNLKDFRGKIYEYKIVDNILMQKDNRSKSEFKNQEKSINQFYKVGYTEFDAGEFNLNSINELILKKIKEGKITLLKQSEDLSNKPNIITLNFEESFDNNLIRIAMVYVKHTDEENKINYYGSRGGKLEIELMKTRS